MKSTKILLDENFKPRISDFGLTRIMSACKAHAGTTQHPSEYNMRMKSSTKGNV
jgi:hypothetical protein